MIIQLPAAKRWAEIERIDELIRGLERSLNRCHAHLINTQWWNDRQAEIASMVATRNRLESM